MEIDSQKYYRIYCTMLSDVIKYFHRQLNGNLIEEGSEEYG